PDPPIADRGQDHRDPGVRGAAKQEDPGDLRAVEELERGGEGEERGAKLEDRGIARVERDERLGRGHEDQRARAHEAEGEDVGAGDGAAYAPSVPRADVLADEDRAGDADAEGYHERRRPDVDGDPVRRQLAGAEPTLHRGGAGQESDLE